MNHETIIEEARQRGTEEEYYAWLRKNPSYLVNTFDEYPNGEGRSVVAHFREVEFGAGTGEKPPYMAVPATQDEHTVQHAHGYDIFNPREIWRKMCYKYLQRWINKQEPYEEEEGYPRKIIIYSANHLNAIQMRLKKYFTHANAKPLEITICPESYKRTNSQNRAWWGVYLPQIQDYFVEHPKEFVQLVINMVASGTIPPQMMHEIVKYQCNDGESSATNKIKFSKLVEESKKFMRDYGVELEDPIPPHIVDF